MTLINIKDGFIPFDEKLRKAIILEANKKSFLSKLGTRDAVDLTTSSVLSFIDYSGAQAVSEGELKEETPFSTRLNRVERGMLQSQVRISVQALDKSRAEGLSILEGAQTMMAGHLGADVDIVAAHNTTPNTGAKALDFNIGLAAGEGTISHKMVEGELPDAAIRAALQDMLEAEKEVTGIAVSPAFFAKLAYQTDTAGRLLYPQLTLTSADEYVFDGKRLVISRTVSNKKGLPGVPSGVSFILGDFSKITWGLELRSIEVITTGDPDGKGDLKRRNEVVLRMEHWLELLITDKSSFRVGLDAPVVEAPAP